MAKKPTGKGAVAGMIGGPMPSKSMSTNVREIDNGYIISKSGYKGAKYVTSEVYTEKAPSFEIQKPGAKPKGK